MTKHKKHIVLLSSEFPPLPGGIGNHAYNLAEQLSQSGYRVSVITDQRDTKTHEAAFDATLTASIHRVAITKPRMLMYLKRLWWCFKWSKSADVLICSGKFPLWIGALLKPLIAAKTMAVIHGTEVNFSNRWLNIAINTALKRFDSIVAVSEYTKSLVSDLHLRSIRVIPNGYSRPNSNTTVADHIDVKGTPKLLTVGNLTERKGQINVIKHLPFLKKRYPQIHYHCVGLKTEIAACVKLAQSLHVADMVTFHGRVSPSALWQFYKNSDICVMLSQPTATGDVEGFGIALIEANSFGVPTIGAKGCGIEDAICDGKSGVLIDAQDAEAFKNAIATILEHNTHFKTHAQEWAEAHHWNTIITRYMDYIEE